MMQKKDFKSISWFDWWRIHSVGSGWQYFSRYVNVYNKANNEFWTESLLKSGYLVLNNLAYRYRIPGSSKHKLLN